MTDRTPQENGAEFVANWRANAERLERDGLYSPAEEHDSCGVGLIATPLVSL